MVNMTNKPVQRIDLCYGDCHGLAPCQCSYGQYRDADGLCVDCIDDASARAIQADVATGDCPWPFATCTTSLDRPSDRSAPVCEAAAARRCCNNTKKVVQLGWIVFGNPLSGGLETPPASHPPVNFDNGGGSCAGRFEDADGNVASDTQVPVSCDTYFCKCVAGTWVDEANVKFGELLGAGRVEFRLAHYGFYRDGVNPTWTWATTATCSACRPTATT